LRGLLNAFVIVVMATLGLTVCTADTDSLCWNNQQLALSDQQIVTYLGLPCSTGSYTGNYSIQAYQGNFDVQYGDQLL
jgi:hypothetical protein